MTRRIRVPQLAWLLAALPLAACGGGGTGTASGRAQTGMSDAEIAGVLDVANRGEVQQAQLARDNASATQVRSYATAMLQGHGQAIEQQQQILSPRGVQPAQSAMAEQIRQRSMQVEQRLQGLSGEEFDRAYMQAQLQQHRDLLRMLDQQLIPSAQDPAYRAYLERLREDLEAHLRHAERIEAEVIG